MAEVDERLYWLGFSLFPGIGPKKFINLINEFSTAKAAWEASDVELLKVLGPAITKKFIAYRPTCNASEYQDRLKKSNVWYVLSVDEQYPQLLKEIDDPPYVLYGRGDKTTLSARRTIGVVGTRKITNYGRQVTEMISREMVNAGFCIVSGLALGVDAVAHSTVLAEKGKTIAVLGCGVDCCSPRENTLLYNRIIAEGGCVISEFPLSQNPTIGSFPSRNRIIAGLSQAVIVTEGAIDSGALITASDALKNNRPVFAIPGPITSSLSRGPNKLLREGAKLVSSGQDILRELQISNIQYSVSNSEIIGETEEAQKIINLLKSEELCFDDLVRETGLVVTGLNKELSMMEMKGHIRRTPSGNYCLALDR